MRISDWSSDVCSSDLAAQGIAADRQSRRPTASPDQRQKNEAQERHFENAGGYRNQGADSGDDMPKGNRPLAVRRKPPVQLFNVVRSEEHTSELPSLMRISFAVFCLIQPHNTTQLITHN